MDCRESRELMSGAVDDQLARNESSGFFSHIEICGSCRDEFELEKLTKAYLRKKITMVEVPDDVEKVIMDDIKAMNSGELGHGGSERIVPGSLMQPLLAVGIVLVVAVVLFMTNMSNIVMPESKIQAGQSQGATDQTILSLVENRFQDVLSGQFKPQITALAASDVANYIEQNAGYAPRLPAVPTADWVGGSVSEVKGGKVCQIVYKMGETFIYIFGFPKQLLSTKSVTLPKDCISSIDSNKKFWTMDEDGDTQVIWGHGAHICVAASNLGRTELAGYLQTSNGSAQ